VKSGACKVLVVVVVMVVVGAVGGRTVQEQIVNKFSCFLALFKRLISVV
jgi:hypothetical protein